MRNDDVPFPAVKQISHLIDALRDYALRSARLHCEQQMTDTYRAPFLTSWDACQWFELMHDWEIVDFLISGNDQANLLVKSLQAFLQWYGQTEVEEILERARIKHFMN
jgi:hypothetical protein